MPRPDRRPSRRPTGTHQGGALRRVIRGLVRSRTRPQPGPVAVTYSPEADGRPDPGEVVWAWVPYEDDPARGKDRPVLVIGRSGPDLVALPLTSQDHDLDAEDEARYGRFWMDVGAGTWDRERRPSEVRLDRLLRLREDAIRREGAVLDRTLFDAVVRAARVHHPSL
jgi:hypothetical protein